MKECGTKEEITLFKWVPIGPIPSETNLTNPYAHKDLQDGQRIGSLPPSMEYPFTLFTSTG